jgi:hypothetical protein
MLLHPAGGHVLLILAKLLWLLLSCPAAGIGQGGCCDVNNFMSSNAALVTLWGGLVGGPDQNDAFPDVRNDYKMSEGKWESLPAAMLRSAAQG